MSTIINATTTNGVVIQPDNSGSLVLQTNSGTTALTIDTSQRAAFVAGTAAAPAITTAGDTNTGMFFPAADTIAFAEGGAEAMRLDSSGNVGIGTTSPTRKLEISGASAAGSSIEISNINTQSTTTAAIGTTGTTFSYSGVGGSTIWYYGSKTVALGTDSANPIQFISNNSERMRITTGGEVYIAGTADQGAYNLQCNGTGVWGAGAYVNGSDARIKENIASIDSGLDVVNKLNPVTYTYKEEWSKDQSTQTGFIAQELLVALEGKNYVDGIVQQGGSYMSVAYQNIIPILTKAIQEQQALIQSQAAAINDLKARIETLEAK